MGADRSNQMTLALEQRCEREDQRLLAQALHGRTRDRVRPLSCEIRYFVKSGPDDVGARRCGGYFLP
jgi:hypothetical protein